MDGYHDYPLNHAVDPKVAGLEVRTVDYYELSDGDTVDACSRAALEIVERFTVDKVVGCYCVGAQLSVLTFYVDTPYMEIIAGHCGVSDTCSVGPVDVDVILRELIIFHDCMVNVAQIHPHAASEEVVFRNHHVVVPRASCQVYSRANTIREVISRDSDIA